MAFTTGSTSGFAIFWQTLDGTCGGTSSIAGPVADAPTQADAVVACGGAGWDAELLSNLGWNTPSNLWACQNGGG